MKFDDDDNDDDDGDDDDDDEHEKMMTINTCTCSTTNAAETFRGLENFHYHNTTRVIAVGLLLLFFSTCYCHELILIFDIDKPRALSLKK